MRILVDTDRGPYRLGEGMAGRAYRGKSVGVELLTRGK